MAAEVERPSWSRPPFEPGHTLSLKHGVNSPRMVEPIAEELVGRLLADPDVAYLRAPSYQPALQAWARAEARVQLLTEYVADRPPVEGKPLPALEQLRQWESTAAKARDKLGLNPLARAALMKQLAATQAFSGIAGVQAAGLAALTARGLRAVPAGGAS